MEDKSSSKPLANLSREELNAQLEALCQPLTNSTDNRRSFFRNILGKIVGIGAVLGMISGCDNEPMVTCYVVSPGSRPFFPPTATQNQFDPAEKENKTTEDKTEEMEEQTK